MKPKLLGFASEAVCSRPYILNIDVAFLMHVAEKLTEGVESLLDVLRLFRLAVGFVRNLDVEVEALLSVFRERLAGDDPIVRVYVLYRYGGHFRLLVKDTGCKVRQSTCNGFGESRGLFGAHFDAEDRHEH